LGERDAAQAYTASWRLADVPALTLPFVAERLRPAVPAPREKTAPLLAALDDDAFPKREAAAAGLRALGDRATGTLRKALEEKPFLEKRRRIEALFARAKGPPSGTALREIRAIATVERIGNPEARRLIKVLANGYADARLTQGAKASLERLEDGKNTARVWRVEMPFAKVCVRASSTHAQMRCLPHARTPPQIRLPDEPGPIRSPARSSPR